MGCWGMWALTRTTNEFMKPEIFAEQLQDLIDRDLSENPPVPRMIYELEMAKNRVVRLQLLAEQKAQTAGGTKSADGGDDQSHHPGQFHAADQTAGAELRGGMKKVYPTSEKICPSCKLPFFAKTL
jgi:hypothetical protein